MKVQKFLRKYFIFLVIAGIAGLVGLITLFKLQSPKETVYVKMKVSQGLWWATTQRPSIWLVNSIKKGDVERSLTGAPLAEIVDIQSYPFWGTDQYDIYITAKLDVSSTGENNKYSFKRSIIGVSSPIDLEFPNSYISGTIIALSTEPFADELVETTITLEKNFAYPWEFDAISIGSTYDDGKQKVFEVLEKKSSPRIYLSQDANRNIPGISEPRLFIQVRAKIVAKKVQDDFVYGEEYIIKKGKTLSVATNDFVFADYMVSSIQ